MLGSDAVILHIEDARKLVDAFLGVPKIRVNTKKKTQYEVLQEAGVLEILDQLRSCVRSYDRALETDED